MRGRGEQMGFLFKSAFWLGVVYWAMPFDPIPALDAGAGAAAVCPAAYAAFSSQLKAVPEPYRKLVAAGCVALASAKGEQASARPADDGGKPPKPLPNAASASLENRDRATPRLARGPDTPPPRRPKKG